MAQPAPIGFEGFEPEGGQKSYAVQFTPSAEKTQLAEEPAVSYGAAASGEEIQLLGKGAAPGLSEAEAEKRFKENTVLFDDGRRRIDFILTYEETKLEEGEEFDEKEKKLKDKRERFIQSCEEKGLEFELQNCDESPDRKTYFLKTHATHSALLEAAEDSLLRMPIRENNLVQSGYRQWFFDKIKVKDPFESDIPKHLKLDKYFTAPFKVSCKDNFIGADDEEKFFSTAQRSALTWHIMQNARYGDDDDQIGILRLLANNCFGHAYPLHDSSHKVDDDYEEPMSYRQFLYHRWSFWKNWYKRQPLDYVRHYFGEKVGIYFTWVGFYTAWLLPASIVGMIVMFYGFSTIPLSRNPPAFDICREENRTDFYMCGLCDTRCDFWYLTDTCDFAQAALLFDNGATVFFAIFMAFWAVLFLEFWKRRQFLLQYEWDMLGYETAEERARPEFEQKIKGYIRKQKTEEAKEKFFVYNPVLEKREYVQPAHWFVPKVLLTFTILASMVLVVVAIVFTVLLYRLAVAGAIYALVSGIEGGPSVADIIVSVTGAGLQLIAILVMNKLYEFFAFKLTSWELHRTQTEYEDSFISKMYLFQFVNFYSSIFYIAFFKGNFTGYPGGYQRIGGLRLDECSTYGCLLELTIQLGIIMVGKQVLNNVQEISVPYVKRLVNWFKHKEETEADVYTRWEKDFDLVPIEQHGLFYEYLELVIQYGFVTIFVAAFPLAPLFALLNNWVEIRLDAHKFVVVQRRPIAERAQDIGAWYSVLDIVSKLSVVTNAFLIAVTAQFVPFEVYTREYSDDFFDSIRNSEYYNDTRGDLTRLSGFVSWSLSAFPVTALLDGEAFPAPDALELNVFIDGDRQDDLLYLPWANIDCLMDNLTATQIEMFFDPYNDTFGNPQMAFTEDGWEDFRDNRMLLSLLFNNPRDTSESPRGGDDAIGRCFDNTTTCEFRGQVNEDGSFPLEYWQSWAARLAFVIVFEHMIFAISAFLAWLVPDVPQSVQNEIQREKLLAYEAIHVRHQQGKDIGGTASPPPGGGEV